MDVKNEICTRVEAVLSRLSPDSDIPSPPINRSKKPDQGDYAAVCFPIAAKLRMRPVELTTRLASELASDPLFEKVEPAGGFLNFWIRSSFLCREAVGLVLEQGERFGHSEKHAGQAVMIEYSSPNTNKPLHLGHIRNNVLGMSLVRLLEAVGYQVHPTCLVNDRGIHICKSMVAYEKFGEGSTPESTGEKGDHFVGRFYVMFEAKFREEFKRWSDGEGQGKKQEWVENNTATIRDAEKAEQLKAADQREPLPSRSQIIEKSFFDTCNQWYFNEVSELGAAARETLRLWEQGDETVRALWNKMNGWVYEGFGETYRKLGSTFEKIYHESETYELGNEVVQNGLEKNLFYRQDDGSVWVDLDDANLGKKLLLRSDGTSVYITQDLGTAILKFRDFDLNLSVMVVASEQNHHFKVLFEILKRLGFRWARRGLFHMSYGMVYLPQGKMKSREGTVVDADELIEQVKDQVRAIIRSGDKIRVAPHKIETTAHQIALGYLKFYLLQVTAQKDMNFNPEEEISLQGDTGVSAQYAAASINSLLGKAGELARIEGDRTQLGETEEVEICKLLLEFPSQVARAAEERNPSLVAQYLLALKDSYFKFYNKIRVLGPGGAPVEGNAKLSSARLELCRAVRHTLVNGLALLNIESPDRM